MTWEEPVLYSEFLFARRVTTASSVPHVPQNGMGEELIH